MATAIEAINDGSEMTASINAKYMAASMNRRDVEDRQADDASATGADDVSASGDGESAESVASIVERQLGTSVEA